MSVLSMDDAVFAERPDVVSASDLPAHARIGHWLEHLIATGKLRVGDRLPPELEMAAELGVSRMTLRQALASVEGKGMLERRRGRLGGNFIARPRVDFSLAGLPGFTRQMREAHVRAGAVVVQATTRVPSAEVRSALRLRRGEQVHEIVRVRSANREPIALEETYLPAKTFQGMLAFRLTGSLYRIMDREYGRAPHAADETIDAIKANPDRAELLGIADEDALLVITRTSYSVDGTPVEYARDYFRPDRTRITLHTQVDQLPVSTVRSTAAIARKALGGS